MSIPRGLLRYSTRRSYGDIGLSSEGEADGCAWAWSGAISNDGEIIEANDMRRIITAVVNKICQEFKGFFAKGPLILKPREISDSLAKGCILISLFFS